MVAALQPFSPAAEQYRTLRTRIAQVESTGQRRVILVTSPGDGDGKTVTAANLALTMAQEFQRQVLLIDADLRNARLHECLGIAREPGLSDVLAGQASLDDALVSLSEYRVIALPAGSPHGRPTELLSSEPMRRLVENLGRRFDRVVMDSTAAHFADAGVLEPLVDGVLLIVRAGRTSRPAVARSSRPRAARQAPRPRPQRQPRRRAVIARSRIWGTSRAMQLFKRNVSPHELILFAMEMMVICAAMVVAIRLHGESGTWPWQIIPAAALCQLCLYYNDVYDLTLVQTGRELLVRLVQAAGAASIILGILYLAVPSIAVQGLPFVQSLAILLVAIPAGRALFTHIARTSLLVDRVLIVGTGQAPREVARELLTRDDPAYLVVGYVDDAPEPRATLGSLPVLGGTRDLSALVERHDIRWIVADLRAHRSRALIDALVARQVERDAGRRRRHRLRAADRQDPARGAAARARSCSPTASACRGAGARSSASPTCCCRSA